MAKVLYRYTCATMVHMTKYQFDSSVRPQDDFYGYVNNNWLEEHPIPESEAHWGIFSELRDESRRNMHTIYKELPEVNEQGSLQQQLGDLYYTGMNLNSFKDAHMAIIHDFFHQIDDVSNASELSSVIGQLHGKKISGPWSTYVDLDEKDSSRHMIRFYQAGLTLPDREYYLDDSEKMREIREAYKQHMARVYDHFPELASSVDELQSVLYEFEHDLAEVSRSSTDLRDIEGNYHKVTFDELKQAYSAIDWDAYALALGWKPSDSTSVDQPEFMKYVNEQLATRSLENWKTYLKWQVIMACYSKVSSELADLRFEFFGRILSGTKEPLPRWKQVVHAIDSIMGQAAGRLYVERHFPEASRRQVLDLVEEVRDTYRSRIKRLGWMSEETKACAFEKLDNIKVLIGYPDSWRDFSGLSVTRDSYLGNILEGRTFDKAYWLERLHQPPSRDDWIFMDPQTVNAYHDPNRLVICFPAAILQAPFFDPNASVASNLGGIGTVIGHELTHGFDDQGRQYDAKGNVREWQTKQEQEAFMERAKVISDQADQFEVLPGLNLKGGLVLGECIADLGGIEIAFETLKHKAEVDTMENVDDLTPRQLFFVNYARTECANVREELLREMTLSDWHPVSVFRVNGMLSHVDDFYRTFDVEATDLLYIPPEKRAKIW
jgi:putative endopeptidase